MWELGPTSRRVEAGMSHLRSGVFPGRLWGRLLYLSLKPEGFTFIAWDYMGSFLRVFESQRDRITTHVRFSPFCLWEEFPVREPVPLGLVSSVEHGWGGMWRVGSTWTRSTHLLKLSCLLKKNSGNLKAQFQNFLLIPVKETCRLTKNSHLGKAHPFLEFFVFFSVKGGFCTLIISSILWFYGQPAFWFISPSSRRLIWLIQVYDVGMLNFSSIHPHSVSFPGLILVFPVLFNQ